MSILKYTLKEAVVFFLLLLPIYGYSQPSLEKVIHDIKNGHKQYLEIDANKGYSLMISDAYTIERSGRVLDLVYVKQTWKNLPISNSYGLIVYSNNSILETVGDPITIDNCRWRGEEFVISPRDAVQGVIDSDVLQNVKLLEEDQSELDSLEFSLKMDGHEIKVEVDPVVWCVEDSILSVAWEFTLESHKQMYRAVVNAFDGSIIELRDMVIYCEFNRSHEKGCQIPNETSGIPYEEGLHQESSRKSGVGTYRVFALPTESPLYGPRELISSYADSMASPFGWHDTNGQVGHDFTVTRGNNVFAVYGLAHPNSYSTDGGPNLEFDFPLDLNRHPSTYIDASITNAFVTCNHFHDILYKMGFDEVSGNFQHNNYGRGGIGGEPMIIAAQDSGRLNNAMYFGGKISMFLWSNSKAGGGFYDSSLENGIIGHEYAHGVSRRMVKGGLHSAEQMGEGWSDWIPLMLSMDTSQSNPARRLPFIYVQGKSQAGPSFRNAPYDTNMTVNGYTYNHTNNETLLSRPHGIGFVWASMLWDLTWDFMREYGYDDQLGNGIGGDDIVFRLVLDGMRFMTSPPGFVDARDAILLADRLTNKGENQCLIWKSFAKRGLGFSADQGSPGSRTDQVEAFDLPPYCINPILPIADFSADTTYTCNGRIQFSDNSSGPVFTRLWDFGDGNTSINHAPTHRYTSPGVYDVKLIISNNAGADTLEKQSYIIYEKPQLPITKDTAVCQGDSIMLMANGADNTVWVDDQYNFLEVGDTVAIGPVDTTTTFFAINRPQVFTVGPKTEVIGNGGYHAIGLVSAGLSFEVLKPLRIKSFYVNAAYPGPRSIIISKVGGTSQGILVQIDGIGPQRIPVDLHLTETGQYNIGIGAAAGLFRNTSGTKFPYTVDNVISITSSFPDSSSYYFLYDWEIDLAECQSDTVPVTVTVIDSVDFYHVVNGMTVSLYDLSGAPQGLKWDLGDGNTSTNKSLTHTYTTPGVYTIKLSIGSCQKEVSVYAGWPAAVEHFSNMEITLLPNPASNSTMLKFSEPTTSQINLQVYSSAGSKVVEGVVPSGTMNYEISVAQLPPGMYYLTGISKDEGTFQIPVQVMR